MENKLRFRDCYDRDDFDLDFDSLVEEFGIDVLTEIAESAYGRTVSGDLYHHLWWNKYIDNFINPWSFKCHFYNLYKYEPDIDNVIVNIYN